MRRWEGKKMLLVANPVSGHGKIRRHLKRVSNTFRGAGLRVDTVITEGPGCAREAASGFTGDLIVCFGGDGTFNEILNGVDLSGPVLAVIPAGTGNVLAKELSIPPQPCKAARAIINGKAITSDVGRVDARRFACMCSAGLDAHIVRMLHERRTGNITQFHYLPHLLKNVIDPPGWEIGVELDGVAHAEKVNLACVSNTRSYGGPIELTPHADSQDRRFDITAARVASPLDIPAAGLAALTRGMTECGFTRCGRASRVRLTARRDDNVPYHIDGDYGGSLPVTVKMEPEPMRVISA